MPGTITYSVQLMLPGNIDRRLRKWSQGMPGASWPAWGGHITLLAAFMTEDSDKLTARITEVCKANQAFELTLDQPVAVQDWTRQDYRAVLLTVRAEDRDSDRLLALQAALDAATADLRTDLRPQISEKAFAPHVTLALGVAEMEAERIVGQIRGTGLRAHFIVDRVWLLRFQEEENGEQSVLQSTFVLPGAVNLLAD